MKVIYIAGKFRGKSAWDIEQNVRRAEELALQAWRLGFAVICPHTNTRFFDGAANDNIWLEGDISILLRCDAVLLVDNWKQSQGAQTEVKVAKENNIPVYETIEELLLDSTE